MTSRGTQLSGPIAEVLSGWPGVDSVTLLQSGSDSFDPYFFLSLDVYCGGDIPAPAVRERTLRNHSAFESSAVTQKDRFFVGDTPVRLEYKQTSRFDGMLEAARSGSSELHDAGTYPFFRITESDVIFARTDWLAQMRAALADLPDKFWLSLRESQQASAEHTYSDLSTAAYRDDELFFIVSVGRFLASLAGLLFTINHEFEPSHRLLTEKLLALPTLPSAFEARLLTFTRQDGSVTVEQRRELAELLITSVCAL